MGLEVGDMPPRTILHVDMDAFFASVEEAINPALAGRPVVVGGQPTERGVVSCPNYLARARGVRTAMPLVEAGRLCPEAVFVPPSFGAYSDFSRRSREIFRSYTPLVEPLSLDEAFLDVTGSQALFGDGTTIAREIQARVQAELGVTCSVGVAATKCCAKVASDLEKPRGLTVVPAGTEAAFLAPLPLGRLPGLGKKTEERLRGWNVTTIGELAALPPELVGRFGAVGQGLVDLARGIDPRPVEPPAEAKSISREHTFGRDSADREQIRRTLQALTDDICRRLRADGRRAATVTVKVRNSRFETRERHRTLPQATDLEEEVWPVVWELAAGLLEGNLPVRLVGAGLSNLQQAGGQLAIDEGERARRRRLHQTVDEIKRRLGPAAVRRASEAGE